ncbi:MAG TPA: DUF4058 family protein [Humisphaera sp.]|jgi:hypothetical protein|nr:DUF4058 family protein [Humisphaera sp.]
MPSPFPGVDPYLEGPSWMSFHGQLIAEIARQLAPRLRPKYVALMDERVVWDAPENDVWIDAVEAKPDVAVMRSDRAGGETGAATIAAPLQMATVMPVPVTHRSVEIRDVANRQLVCAIEVLSPTNKRGHGRRKYLHKRGKILQSSAHLIEIDLLRQGQRVPMAQTLPDYPYFAFVSRHNERPSVGVWPIGLRDRLPTIPVPLLAGDADVPLDLQQAQTNVYDLIGYDTILNYAVSPAVALSPADAQWVADVARCVPR